MEGSPIVRLTGVYNADTGLAGEARYLLEKLTGRASCALCDITHGTSIRGKTAWRRCRAALPVPFAIYHRNDQPADLVDFTPGLLPCVVAHHETGELSLAVTAQQLIDCDHHVDALETLLLKLL